MRRFVRKKKIHRVSFFQSDRVQILCPFFGSSLAGSRRAGPGLSARGSRGLGPTEQHRHLPIGHSLLLSDAHGLTQVDRQDVLALREKEKRVFKERSDASSR